MGVSLTNGYWKAARALLAVTGHVQRVLPKPGRTHGFCLEQAIPILHNDGFTSAAQIVGSHLEDLHEGVTWADSSWKNSSHFLDPYSHKGIWRWPNAIVEAQVQYDLALRMAREGKLAKSMFYLGAVAHLIQDLCVPHHAHGVLRDGHQEFEDWASSQCYRFAVDNGGIYHKSPKPARWLIQNAKIAYPLYHLVAETDRRDYVAAAKILIPLAQRSTAGLLGGFCQQHILAEVKKNNFFVSK